MIKKHFRYLLLLPLLLVCSVIHSVVLIERVSVNDSGVEGNDSAHNIRYFISADGRYVVFESPSDNLIPTDTNASLDVFVYDRWNRTIETVSVNDSGIQGNDHSREPSISADGRYVSFTSWADNLVAGDTNNYQDVFVYDRQTKTIERVSVDSSENEANYGSADSTLSPDGRYITFLSGADNLVAGDVNGRSDIFVRDRQLGTTECITFGGNNHCSTPRISSSGRYVTFSSRATNLVAGSDINAHEDVFLYDRQTSTMITVSEYSDGTDGNGLSAVSSFSFDERYIVFQSFASNLVDNDMNGAADVFRYDIQTDALDVVSVCEDGSPTNGGHSGPSCISENGRYVVFASEATNLVDDGLNSNSFRDLFIRDYQENSLQRITIGISGEEADGDSAYSMMTPDGKYVAFISFATNLVDNDTNNALDAFVASNFFCDDRPPSLTIKAIVDPENSDYITISVSSDKEIDCATLYVVVEPHSTSHDPVTITSFTKVDSTRCEGTYHRDQGFGDVKAITAYARDSCGTLGHSDGTFEREVISGKPVVIAHNRINPTVPGDEAVIQYRAPQSGRVEIEVFDKLGRLICTLVDTQAEGGTQQVKWDGRNDKGGIVASGIYFVTIRTSEYTVKENVVVIK